MFHFIGPFQSFSLSMKVEFMMYGSSCSQALKGNFSFLLTEISAFSDFEEKQKGIFSRNAKRVCPLLAQIRIC